MSLESWINDIIVKFAAKPPKLPKKLVIPMANGSVSTDTSPLESDEQRIVAKAALGIPIDKWRMVAGHSAVTDAPWFETDIGQGIFNMLRLAPNTVFFRSYGCSHTPETTALYVRLVEREKEKLASMLADKKKKDLDDLQQFVTTGALPSPVDVVLDVKAKLFSTKKL